MFQRGEGVVALPYNSNGPTMNPGIRFNQSIIYLILATYWDRDMQCNPLSVGCSVNRAGQISKPLPFPPRSPLQGRTDREGPTRKGSTRSFNVYVRKHLDFRQTPVGFKEFDSGLKDQITVELVVQWLCIIAVCKEPHVRIKT